MDNQKLEQARLKLKAELDHAVNIVIDELITGVPAVRSNDEFPTPEPPAEPKRELPKDKRVIRTKSTGDRVYLIDETAKTKAWVTSPEILGKLGFELSDVQDVDDKDLLGYAMTASVYRVEE